MRPARILLVTLLMAAIATSGAQAAPGELDPSFGSGGKVTTDFARGDDNARGLAIQADGKIVAVGFSPGPQSSEFALARYTPEGQLDPSFGNGGKVTTDFGKFDEAAAVAIQADGKIVAAGFAHVGETLDFALARYTPEGQLDPAFGDGGKVTTDFAARNDNARGLAI